MRRPVARPGIPFVIKLSLAVLVSTIVACLWFWLRKPVDSDPRSIVILLKEPRFLDAHILADIFSKVTEREVGVVASRPTANGFPDLPAADKFTGTSPHLLGLVDGTVYAVNNLSVPYMENREVVAAAAHELRLRKAIADHKAWISVDILDADSATAETYRVVARVIGHLIGPDCLALYHPPLNQYVTCDVQKTTELLASEDPMQAVFGQPNEVPVIPVENDDPRLKAAEAEAQRHFPEFRTAFEKHDGTDFSVKTRVTADGNSEHIWVEVHSISGDLIEGVLGNKPVNLGTLELGSKIQFQTSQVEDWIFNRHGTPVGMYTVPVMEQIAREKVKKKR